MPANGDRLHPRDVIIGKAQNRDDDRAHFWTAIFYGAEFALHMGRDVQALAALEEVVTGADQR